MRIRFIEKILAGDFARERQEACRQQQWLKVMGVRGRMIVDA